MERVSTRQALENLPTHERVKKGNMVQNERSTRAQVRYPTRFFIAVEMGYLDPEMEYYHNRYCTMRMVALGRLDTQTAQFLYSGDRATVPLPTTEQSRTPEDDYRFIILRLSYEHHDYVEFMCEPVPAEEKIIPIKATLTALSAQIERAFLELKKAVDQIPESDMIGFE